MSISRPNLSKNCELEFQNRKLLLELAKERELREQANEKLRSCGLGNILASTSDCPSLSIGRSHQATTSIASAPEVSISEADLQTQIAATTVGEVHDDIILGTQVSLFY